MSRFQIIHGGRSNRPLQILAVDARLWRVMLRLLQQEIDSASFEQLQAHHSELRALTISDVQTVITNAQQRTGGRP